MPENHTNKNTQPPKKKRLTWWKITLIILALLLALLILKVVLILTAKPTISVDYVAELNRISKPPNYDPNQNAALDYRKAIAVYADMPKKIRFSLVEWPDDMNEAELNCLNQWVNANSETLSHLKQGSAKPCIWMKATSSDYQWGFKLDFQLTSSWELCDLLFWHAKLNAMDDQFDRSLEDLIAGYRLGSHLMAPTRVGVQLLGIGLKGHMIKEVFVILANKQLGSSALVSLHQQLQYQMSHNQKELDFQGDKICVLDAVQRTFTDNGKGNGYLIATEPAKQFVRTTQKKLSELAVYVRIVAMGLLGPDRKTTARSVEEYFAYLHTLRTKTPWQMKQMGIASDAQIYEATEANFIIRATNPVYLIIGLFQKQRAAESALLTTIAALRYKADKGQLPKNLQELISAGYLEELPMDPYSDGPLVYKRTGDGFILYSVGADFDDDGGIRSDWGQYEEGGDQVFWPVKPPE